MPRSFRHNTAWGDSEPSFNSKNPYVHLLRIFPEDGCARLHSNFESTPFDLSGLLDLYSL